MATIAAYPSSVYIDTLIDVPVNFKVERYEFEDGGMDVNVQKCGIRRWELRYTGLSAEDLHTLETHYIAAKGRVNDFEFQSRRTLDVFYGVKYASFTIPARARHWNNEAVVVLEGLV